MSTVGRATPASLVNQGLPIGRRRAPGGRRSPALRRGRTPRWTRPAPWSRTAGGLGADPGGFPPAPADLRPAPPAADSWRGLRGWAAARRRWPLHAGHLVGVRELTIAGRPGPERRDHPGAGGRGVTCGIRHGGAGACASARCRRRLGYCNCYCWRRWASVGNGLKSETTGATSAGRAKYERGAGCRCSARRPRSSRCRRPPAAPGSSWAARRRIGRRARRAFAAFTRSPRPPRSPRGRRSRRSSLGAASCVVPGAASAGRLAAACGNLGAGAVLRRNVAAFRGGPGDRRLLATRRTGAGGAEMVGRGGVADGGVGV